MQVTHGVEQPAAPAEAAAERQGRPLAAAERAEHHRDRQPAHQGRMADAAEGDVVDQIDPPVRQMLAGVAVSQDLPHQMHQMPDQAPEPERHPLALQAVEPGRHEELEAQRRWQPTGGDLSLDLGAQLGLGQRDHLMAEACGLDRPVPADTFLRAPIGAAGEDAHEDLHGPSIPGRGSLGRLHPIEQPELLEYAGRRPEIRTFGKRRSRGGDRDRRCGPRAGAASPARHGGWSSRAASGRGPGR